MRKIKWSKYRLLIVEVFVLANLGFLALDIFIAHSTNSFQHPAQWLPFFFSLCAPILLSVDLVRNWRRNNGQQPCFMGMVVGYSAIALGLAGLLFHLSSGFFVHQTIKSLVYNAPFVAPLAYTGLGFLLLLNRMVKPDKLGWGQWLIFLGLGGFLVNFVSALCDHAQNGFFVSTEWIPVISGAMAVGFLMTALLGKCSRKYLDICLVLMIAQIFVGILGFSFHLMAVYKGAASSLFENLVYQAPVFAPLLFANLAVLAGLGLWDVRSKQPQQSWIK